MPFSSYSSSVDNVMDHFHGRNISELHHLTDQLFQWYQEQQQTSTSSFHHLLQHDERKQQELKGILVDTEKAIRWWTTLRTIDGVQQGLALFQEFVYFLPHMIILPQEEEDTNQNDYNNLYLLGNNDTDDDDHIWTLWLTGRYHYPIATHVLNALVDSWRIGLKTTSTTMEKNQEANDNDEVVLASILPTPYEMLQLVMRWHTTHGIPIDNRAFNIIMLAAVEQQKSLPQDDNEDEWSRQQREEVPLFCERILNIMVERGNLDAPSSSYPPWFDYRFAGRIRPDVISFSTALNAWAESGRPDSGKRARQLLEEVLQLFNEGWLHDGNNDAANNGTWGGQYGPTISKPSVITYNTVLKALASMRQTSDMEQAESMLNDMLVSPDLVPNTVTFHTVIEGWLAIDNIPRAYGLLNKMIELYEAGHDNVDVDATFFSKLIFVLARNKGVPREQVRKRTALAMQLYEQLVALYKKTNDPRFQPELTTIRSMIMVLASQDRPEEAEILLKKLEELATVTNDVDMLPRYGHYGDVLFAWSRSGLPQAAERAESLLLRWIQSELTISKHMNKNSNKSPGDTANQENQHQYLVDDSSIELVFELWTKSGQDDACERAEALLRNLYTINEAIRHLHHPVRISPSHYLFVMQCWSRSGRSNSAERTHDLLFELLQLHDRDPTFRPTQFHFTTAIEAWAYSNDRNAPQRAQLVFDEAVARATARNKKLILDHKLYSSLIHAFANNWQPEKAEEALLRMLYDRDHGNMLLKPTAPEFNLVLRAWVKSRNPNAQRRCQALVSLMQKRGIQPDRKTLELMEKAATPSQPYPGNRGSSKTNKAGPSLRKKTTLHK